MSFKSTVRRLATRAQSDLKSFPELSEQIAEMLARQTLELCEMQDKFDREDAAKVDARDDG